MPSVKKRLQFDDCSYGGGKLTLLWEREMLFDGAPAFPMSTWLIKHNALINADDR